jgi:predicted metal-dependent HD superfamily phosphohydrolase
LETAYAHQRYYHNFYHLHALWQELLPVQDQVDDWEIMVMTLFYHDIIYDVQRQDNEEQSAHLASKALGCLNFDISRMNRCSRHILFTKNHQPKNDVDSSIFCSADLAILGSEPGTYDQYLKAVRKEFSFYPDEVFLSARKKFIEDFLKREKIYPHIYFHNRYESRARMNLLGELMSL